MVQTQSRRVFGKLACCIWGDPPDGSGFRAAQLAIVHVGKGKHLPFILSEEKDLHGEILHSVQNDIYAAFTDQNGITSINANW